MNPDGDPGSDQGSDPDPDPTLPVLHRLENKKFFTAVPVYTVLSFSSASQVSVFSIF